jgi:hypothetical protein
MSLFEHEEEIWHQRGKENWLLKGDNNTEYYHRIANGHKRKKTIFSLQDGSNTIQRTPDLLNHATLFYKSLFAPQVSNNIKLRDDVWDTEEKLSKEERNNLDSPFTEEEIKNVIDQMEKNKATWRDGFPIEFYQACRDIIKEDLMAVFHDFHQHKIDLSRINYGIINLMPKGEDATTIQKYGPICLLQVLFKIFTKTMTVRSETIMTKLINSCQNTFIKGRFITDGVSLLQEILRESKVGKQQGVIFKIDFEKFYDKVNWEFLFDCCRQKGFSEKCLIWIKSVVTQGTLSVKLNDKIGPYFASYNGVRQGDPFAPTLFNVAVNSLSKMIQLSQQNGRILGLANHIIDNGMLFFSMQMTRSYSSRMT